MGLLSRLAETFGINIPFISNSKQPSFYVSEFLENKDYSKLLDSNNYLDQYIGWTYKAVTMKANACTSVEPRLMRKTSGNKTEEIPFDRSQLLQDLFRFNEDMTLSDARYLIHLHLGLAGIAFVYINSGIKSKDFYVLNPERFSVVLGKNGLPIAYKFEDVNGEVHEIPKEEILVFRHPDPKNWLRGWSPVLASKYPHNAWEYAMQLNMNTFANQGKMQGILTFLNIGEAERKRIERTLREKYQGPKNAGKIMVTDVVPNWIPLGNSIKDLEYIEGIKLMREEILSIQGVPEPLAVSSSTYNNVKEAERIFAKYTIDPLLMKEASVYTEQLIPRYFPENSQEAKKLYIEFPKTEKPDLDEVNNSFKFGIVKLNEARRKYGYDDDPINGDKYVWELKINATNENNNELKRFEKKSILENLRSRAELKDYFLTKTINAENKLKKVIDEFFSSQKLRVLENVKRYKDVTMRIDFDLEKEIILTVQAFREVFRELAEIFNEQANQVLASQQPLNDTALKELEKNLEYFAKEINKTTQNDLLEILAFGIENSLSQEDIKEEIKNLFDRYLGITQPGTPGIDVSRAETIARTETNKIKNNLTYRRYRNAKEVIGYEWLATGGEGSRPNHNAVDGVRIKKGEMFVVGGHECTRPHDPRLPASEVINCRCDILPVIDQI